MKAIELPKAYNPGDFEERIYAIWKDGGFFEPFPGNAEPFVIVMPPPNVTGVLHMGHGLNNALQDILTRYWRMKGRPSLWVPGTDHAGIATQNVVERQLKQEGRSRRDLGREKFLERTWKVKEEHHAIIAKQLRTIGASCDWSRERFTMDSGCSKAVREVFVTLYERDLLYRGEYLVNWCPSCGTALADDEVDHEEKQGGLWEIRYALTDGSGSLTVVTTRPETMFGDTAVAVNPEDERYRDIVGKTVILPISGKEIPVITDSYVEKEFGTGCLKVTPAHDVNDYEIGRRNNLESINVLNSNGTMNNNVPEFLWGLPAKDARKATAARLEELGALAGYKEHIHQVGHCYRCSTVVEPFLSDQWFVRMKPLADKALTAWRQKEVIFHPAKWENTYRHWLENLRDWCISRQIWWGHRIPAWTCQACGKIQVLREDPKSCPSCGGELVQDTDVLDTWFSSWLWPFSTLGWPEKTADLDRFYPTSTLVTGYDIIFFWVARMIMAGLEFMGQVPFRDIYITGLVRDKKGRKMSKSLGNGIDPMEIVASYGADAMIFTLAYLSAQGEDIPMDMDTFKLGSRFANKVWNAARFILMNLDGLNLSSAAQTGTSASSLAEKWIYHRLNQTIHLVENAMASYRFDELAHAVYEFFWNDYCDWYVETSKLGLYSGNHEEKSRTAVNLLDILEKSLALLHPLLPFISEEIWGKLPETGRKRMPLIVSPFPKPDDTLNNPQAYKAFTLLQEMVRGIRTLRSEFTIAPAESIKVRVQADADTGKALSGTDALAAMLVRSDDYGYLTEGENLSDAIPVLGRGFTVHVFIKNIIDVGDAIVKFRRLLKKTEEIAASKQKKLDNENFRTRAPEAIIIQERKSLSDMENTASRLRYYLTALEKG